MTPDLINGVFELVASLMVVLNCRRLLIDKKVRGVSKSATAFFIAWGFYGLGVFLRIESFWSVIGAITLISANIVWLAMMMHYAQAEHTLPKMNGNGH